MSRKFSIMTKINLNKLDEQIQAYQMLNQWDGECGECDDPYIFMSEDTAKAIETEVGVDVVIDNKTLTNNIKSGMHSTYSGYKVFINNDLRFGIVEIR